MARNRELFSLIQLEGEREEEEVEEEERKEEREERVEKEKDGRRQEAIKALLSPPLGVASSAAIGLH